ncbi:MAG: hypothetical protein Q7S17_05140 [Xanthobacteraceae bacterium]|nr:hypothetical protein [Xanthobacteraceae bacterium]
MSKHTPGPIEVVEAKTLDNSGQWHIYLAAPDGRKIAALWGNQTEKIANAHLYAAAPNMLAALRLVIKLMDDGTLVRDISKDGKPDWALNSLALVRDLQTIQAAIAQATKGNTP